MPVEEGDASCLHYETYTAIAAENIGITRVADKIDAIGRVEVSQDGDLCWWNRTCRAPGKFQREHAADHSSLQAAECD